MDILKTEPLNIEPDLRRKLGAMAEKTGAPLDAFVNGILRAHIAQAEQEDAERLEDEQRWARYLTSGACVSFDEMRDRLRALSAKAETF